MVIEIGPRYALHSGASSRAILAFLPDSLIDDAVRQLRGQRPDLDEETYRKNLAEIRVRGYATSLNERNTGAASIAAPFFDAAGNVMGSISSSGPAFRYAIDEHDEHATLVIDAAKAITQRLRG